MRKLRRVDGQIIYPSGMLRCVFPVFILEVRGFFFWGDWVKIFLQTDFSKYSKLLHSIDSQFPYSFYFTNVCIIISSSTPHTKWRTPYLVPSTIYGERTQPSEYGTNIPVPPFLLSWRCVAVVWQTVLTVLFRWKVEVTQPRVNVILLKTENNQWH